MIAKTDSSQIADRLIGIMVPSDRTEDDRQRVSVEDAGSHLDEPLASPTWQSTVQRQCAKSLAIYAT